MRNKHNVAVYRKRIIWGLLLLLPVIILLSNASDSVLAFLSSIRYLGSILVAVAALVVAVLIYRRHLAKEDELSGGFKAFSHCCFALSDREMVKVVIQEELSLRFRDEGKPVSKKTLWLRTILTAAYLALSGYLLYSHYYRTWVIFLLAALLLAYELLFLQLGTVNVLYHTAKRKPQTPISQLIEQDVFDERNFSVSKTLLVVGVAVLAAALVAFFSLTANPRMYFEEDEGGYCVSAYKPGLFTTEERIPASHNGQPVVAIAPKVFSGITSLEAISIPETVVRIGGEAFKDCSRLQSMVIPKGVTEIRGNTFENCRALNRVTLHDGIIDIHAYAFRNCSSLEEIQLPSRITEIHAYTFEGCSALKSIEIPFGVTRIAAHAFYGCKSLSQVSVPYTVREVGSSAFRDCDSLKQITLPYNAEIDERAFKDSPTIVERK